MNNQAAFIADCLSFQGIGSFVSLTLVTEPKLTVKDRVTKEPRPFQKLTKVQSFVNAMIGSEYESRVNNQRKREGIEESFEADKASGRTRINSILSHKDGDESQLYLSLYIDKATATETVYLDENDNAYTWEQVQNFLPLPKTGNAKQGVENEIRIIAPKLESITAIQAFGKVY